MTKSADTEDYEESELQGDGNMVDVASFLEKTGSFE